MRAGALAAADPWHLIGRRSVVGSALVAKTCIFCERRELTREHVFGKWLTALLPGEADFFTRAGQRDGYEPHTQKTNQGASAARRC